MSEFYLNEEAAALDYVKTALESRIPDLTERERLVFDSIAKFGGSVYAQEFGVPERMADWLQDNYQKVTGASFDPTTSKESERLDLAKNLRIIAEKLEEGESFPNKSDLLSIPLKARKIELNQTYYDFSSMGKKTPGAKIVAGDLDENRLENFAELLENNDQLYMTGSRKALSQVEPVRGTIGQERSLSVAPTIANYVIVQRLKQQAGEDISPIKLDFDPQSRNTFLVGRDKEVLLELDDPYRPNQANLKMWDKTNQDLVLDVSFHKQTKIWSVHDRSANQLMEKDLVTWNDQEFKQYLQKEISQKAPILATEMNLGSKNNNHLSR